MVEASVNHASRRRRSVGACCRSPWLSASLIALALLSPPDADKADCGVIANRYTLAVGGVIDALHRYEKCVAASNARDDCAAEMEALDSAHDGFADAVADAKTCR